MGNRFSRRKEAPAAKAESPEPEQIAVGETVEESVPECQEAPAAFSGAPNQEHTKPEAAEVEAPSPEQHLSPASEPTPPESEGEPAPAAEVQPTTEEPETVPKPDPAPCPEAEVIPAPLLGPVPAPEPGPEADLPTLETRPKPVISEPLLVDLSVPEAEPIIKPSFPSASPAPLDVDETPEVEEGQDSPETAVVSTLVQEKNNAEIFPEKENDDTMNVDEIINDANEENVSGLLKQLALTGNDIVADLILSDVKVPDDSPSSTSTHLI